MEGKCIMVLRIRAFMPRIEIMQLNELSEVRYGSILPVFLVMLIQIPELYKFIQELSRANNLEG
jgi:hypothetical protein